MIVSKTSSGGRDSEVSVLWQDNILRSDAELEVLLVIGHSIVYEDCQSVLEIFYLGSDRKRLVPEVPETASELLGGAVILMVVHLGSVIDHGGDVGIIMFVVVVKRVKEDSETDPLIVGAVDWTFDPLRSGVPEGETISSYSSSA